MSETLCRFCRAPVEAVFADLGMSPLANSYLPPERANGMEPFYPLRALRLRRSASWCSSRSSRRPSRSSPTTPTSRPIPRAGWSTAASYAEQMIERFGLGARQPRRRDRLQRRLPAAVLPRAPDPRARDRAGGERRQGGAAEGHSHAGRVLRAGDRDARLRASRPPTCCWATTCLRTSPTSTTSSAG